MTFLSSFSFKSTRNCIRTVTNYHFNDRNFNRIYNLHPYDVKCKVRFFFFSVFAPEILIFSSLGVRKITRINYETETNERLDATCQQREKNFLGEMISFRAKVRPVVNSRDTTDIMI